MQLWGWSLELALQITSLRFERIFIGYQLVRDWILKYPSILWLLIWLWIVESKWEAVKNWFVVFSVWKNRSYNAPSKVSRGPRSKQINPESLTSVHFGRIAYLLLLFYFNRKILLSSIHWKYQKFKIRCGILILAWFRSQKKIRIL